jgi:2-polyprenyl-3-methyl-5-hydroxy-6-metoxy-1,4-benzoquinol methylase
MLDRISKCISCESTDIQYYADHIILKIPIYICQNCKLYITGKSQKELNEILENFYKNEYWDKNRDSGLTDLHDDPYSIGRKKLFLSQFKYMQNFLKKNSKILEIGSGHGETLIEFDKLSFHVTGIEPDAKNVKHLSKILKNSRIIQTSVEEFKTDEKYDLIWMSHIFEHLSDPISFLNNIKKNMNKDCILFIEVPSVTKKNDYRKFRSAPHAYNYSSTALQNLLKKTDYKIISCDHFGSPKKINGLINKIFKTLLKKDFYKYYPKMRLTPETGEDIRIIVQNIK